MGCVRRRVTSRRRADAVAALEELAVDESVFPERVVLTLSYVRHADQWQLALHDWGEGAGEVNRWGRPRLVHSGRRRLPGYMEPLRTEPSRAHRAGSSLN